MVATTLTKEMIDAGAALIHRLDEQGARPDAAFWYYFSETQQWKLVLAESKLGEEGPRVIYKKIQEIMDTIKNDLGDLSLEDVTLVKPENPPASLLLSTVLRGAKVNGVRLGNNVIQGTVIEDAYLYRLM